MPESPPIFTREEIKLFSYELKAKFRSGIRSPIGPLYIFLMLFGIGLTTLGIPIYNESEISPETFGIYVIGFLVTVALDAMVIWKKTGNDNQNEQAIAVIFIVISSVLIVFSSLLSIKTFHLAEDKTRVGEWKSYGSCFLSFIFLITIVMFLILTGIDSQVPKIGSLEEPVTAIRDR